MHNYIIVMPVEPPGWQKREGLIKIEGNKKNYPQRLFYPFEEFFNREVG